MNSIELAKERVKTRVAEGGHNIEAEVIERRYHRGVKNLFELYLPIVDKAFIYDNSAGEPEILAQRMVDSELIILNNLKFNELKNDYDYR